MSDALINEAKAAIKAGHGERATALLRGLAQRADIVADAWVELGGVCLASGAHQNAAACYSVALAQDAHCAAAHLGRAVTLARVGQFDEAQSVLRDLLTWDDHNAAAWAELGHCQTRQHDFAAAARPRAKALDIDSSSARAWHLLANVHRAQGESARAASGYRAALDRSPSGLLFYDLARMAPEHWPNGLDQQISHYLAAEKLSDADRSLALFAAATIAERRKDYDLAFNSYQQANGLQAASATVGVDQLRDDVRILSRARLPDGVSGSDSEVPVFVIGAPRSGTSLTEQILSAHTKVGAIGEQAFFSGALTQHIPLDKAHSASEAAAARVQQDYLNLLARSAGTESTRIVDKMPDNAYLLGLINDLFPRARIVNVRRHPLAVLISIYTQSFAVNRRYYCDLVELADYLKIYAKTNRSFADSLDLPWLDIHYELLVAALEPTVRSLLDFCGLEFDAACLVPHTSHHAVLTASDWQVRQPVHSASVARWERFAPHLRAARDTLAEEIERYERDLEQARSRLS